MTLSDGWNPIYITLSITFIIIAVLAFIDPSVATPMIKDDGLIQLATAAVLCCVVVLALLHVIAKTPPVLKWAEASLILCIYGMREMDFHRLFTAEHITRLKLYTGPFPLEQKLIGGIIMLTFIAVMLHFAAANSRLFSQGLKNKAHRSWHLVVWGVLLLGAQIIDKPHLFRGLLKKITEETMEFGAAIMMLFILLSFPLDLKKIFQRKRS